jgi:Reverse transcriptase (RNA-dependent DNA polymerase)
MLKSRDPKAFKLLKPIHKKEPTPIDISVWNDYVAKHFKGVSQQDRTSADHINNDSPDSKHPFTVAQFQDLVDKLIGKMNTDTSSGFEGLPVEFIKYAVVTDIDQAGTQLPRHVLLPFLSKLFHAIFTLHFMPDSWKVAKLSPIYKKGLLLRPDSYRMIAVNCVAYRLFANVVRDFMTTWCINSHQMPDTQFGFFPDRSTLHPLFILHHCIMDAKSRPKGKTRSKLYSAFVDYTQAYDSINRQALWEHLTSIAVPAYLINIIKEMYTDDSYVLVDGGQHTQPLHPTLGVKQGCPLSPLLFALYINDFLNKMPPQFNGWGYPLREASHFISHIFYADDLLLLSKDPNHLQQMLNALSQYSKDKGLTVNVTKSQIVVFNSRANVDTFNFYYDGHRLDVVDEFKYLGLIFNKSGSLHQADKQWARALYGAIKHVLSLAKEHGLRDRLDVILQLYQSYALPIGMYGSHVWSTMYLKPDKIWSSRVELQHLFFLRHLFGARKDTCTWSLLSESGQRPFQFYWWRAVLNFWNSMLTSNNILLLAVIKSDVALASVSNTSWTSQVLSALDSLPILPNNNDNITQSRIRSLQTVNVANVLRQVTLSYTSFWDPFHNLHSFRGLNVPNRKTATYALCFKRTDPCLPHYLSCNHLSFHDVRNVARFRLGSHNLFVERGRFQNIPWPNRICRRCLGATNTTGCSVDDEHHMIFDCCSFDQLRSNNHISDILRRANNSVKSFCDDHNVFSVSKFISCCMNIVDASVSGAEQPPLAEGHPM